MATTLKPAIPSTSLGVVVQYHLHRHGQDATILAGSSVLSRESVCPPFQSCPNKNLFQQFFGIEFHHDGHTYVCAISTYEFYRCFGLVDNIQYRLSHNKYKFGLDVAMPGRTSSWIFDQVHCHLVYLQNTNSEIFLPNQFTAPAATIQALVNGAIRTRLPSKERWIQAYTADTELCAVLDLALNPSKITNKSLANSNHNYRRPLRQSLIIVKYDMLFLHKPIIGTSSFT